MTTARRDLSSAKSALLQQRLRATREAGSRALAIPRQPDDARPQPSFGQERMFFLEQFAPGTSAYHITFGVRLRGPLDSDALAAAVQAAGARHDSLRMSFTLNDDGETSVRIADAVTVPWTVVTAPDEAAAEALLADLSSVPFDLGTAPLVRVTLVRLAPEDHVLHVLLHHIVSDGTSCSVLLDDVAALYEAELRGTPPPPAPAVRYTDFAAWQRQHLAGDGLGADVDFWRRTLAGVPPLDLPTDHRRPVEMRFGGASVPLRVDPQTTQAVRELAARHGATLYMTALGAFSALLSRYSGATDFAVGTPVEGRSAGDVDSVVGLFVNTLAMRADLTGDPSFATLVDRCRERVLDVLAHQDMPFEKLVQALGVERDVSRTPVFQVLLALQNYDNTMGTWPGGLVAEWFAVRTTSGRFDLTLYLYESSDEVTGSLVYNTALFDEATAQRMAGHFVTLLQSAVAEPDAPLSQLPLLVGDEEAELLGWSSGPPADAAASGQLQDLFDQHVRATPHAPAVVCGEEHATYAELDARANQLAHLLRRRGVGRDVCVGICLEQSVDLAVTVLAVLRAGGAYVPLDPEQPASRLSHMLADSAPAVVITSRAHAEELPGDVMLLEDVADEIARESTAAPIVEGAHDLDLAYVIYTSGSTGRPKGVAVAHRQLLHYLDGVTERFAIVPGARYALLQSISFDFSVTVFWLALATGGCVHLVPRRGTGPELADYLAEHQIDYLKMTPSHFAALAAEAGDAALLPARALIFGGESSQLPWARTLAEHTAVFNHYGPTEATVGATTFAVTADAAGAGATPIGEPLRHAAAYVLDGALRPAPVGVPGEIYLGGDRLARGYLNQPALTADRFVPDPYGAPGRRMYRTGDLGRWTADGQLEFLGRADHQVKLRGYRVELGDVEAAMSTLPGVGQAVVVLHQQRLVAYLEKRPDAVELDEAEVRRRILDLLPEYMLPSTTVWLDALPLQEHGKVDRRALPAPTFTVATGEYVEPRGEVQTTLASIWRDLLQVERVGADDDFFHLGGHSLLATQVVARLRRALPDLPRPVGVVDMFKHRTVRALAQLAVDVDANPRTLLIELTPPVARTALQASIIAVPYGGASAVVYQPLAAELPAGFALYGVAVPGHDIGVDEEIDSLEKVAAGCVAEILESVDGPLIVYGHCGPGSALAVEITRQLEAADRAVDALYVGGIFPFARPSRGVLGALTRVRLVERMRGDRVHANWLRGMGADLGALDDAQVAFLIRAMREDAILAEEYFTRLLSEGVAPLSTPVISVVGERDPGAEWYDERFREWHFLSSTSALVVLEEAGHYFLKFRAGELAEIVTGVHAELGEPAPVVDRSLPWQLRAVSHTSDAPDAPDAPQAVEADAGPQPSMRRYLAVASGQIVSMTGSALTEFAIPLHVYVLTGSLFNLGLFAALGLVPGMLVAPLAGAVIDRSDRRRVMLAADVAAASLLAILAIAHFTDNLQIGYLYAFVGCLSVALAFQRLAYASAIPQLVPKQYIGHANGVAQTATGIAQFMVPLLAVGLLAYVGVGGILVFDLISYTFAITVVLLVKFPRSMAWRPRETLWQEIKGGFAYAFGNRGFRAMLVWFAGLNLFLAPLFLLVSPLVLATDTIEEVGRVSLAGGAGAILGGLVMTLWGGPRRLRFRGVLGATVGIAVGAVVVGSTPSLWVVGAGVFVLAACLSVMNGIYATIVQTKVPQRFHGRVISVNTMAAWCTLPVAWLLVTPLATRVAEPLLQPEGGLAGTLGAVIGTGPGRGIAAVYVLFALAIVATALLAGAVPALRHFDRDVPDAEPDDVIGLQALAARGHHRPSAPVDSDLVISRRAD